MKRFAPVIILLVISSMLLGLAACGRSKKNDEDRDHNREINEVNEELSYYAEETEAAEYNDYYLSGGYSEEAAPAEMYDEYESDYVQTSVDSSVNDVSINYNNRMLIRRVTMDVETLRYNDVIMSVRAQTIALGGYSESSSEYGTGEEKDLRTASLVIRVPSEYLDELIGAFGGYCTVLSQSEYTEDVTLQYTDIESHIEALRAEQSTLLELLADTSDVNYIIQLQNRLSEISYEIESYESQARVLANLSSFGTLTLTVREAIEEEEEVTPTPTPEDDPSFREEMRGSLNDTLKDIRKGVRNLAVDFAGVLPYILIALAALIPFVIILIIVIAVHKKHKKAAKAAVATDSAAENEASAETPVAAIEAETVPEDRNSET